MSTRHHPLSGIELLLVDGNNLLHRESGSAGEGALRGLLARLQAAVRGVPIVVVLDGHAAPGSSSRQRVSATLEVRHAGSRSADDLLVQLATAQPLGARGRTVLVSDDRALRDRARSAGCRAERLGWLQALLQPRPRPRPGVAREQADDEAPDEGWRPGRGATRKRGNPRRAPRRR